MSDEQPPVTVITERLRLGTGFVASERDEIVERLAALGTRLRSFSGETVELEISVKGRDGAGQRVALECWIAGRARLVSTSAARELPVALTGVRDDMIRQIDDAKTRREPRNNRMLRRRYPPSPQPG